MDEEIQNQQNELNRSEKKPPDMGLESDWQSRHKEAEKQKEELRQHFHGVADKAEQAKKYYRPAKPTPTIDDSDQALSVHALLADWESANKSRRMILSYDQRILTGQYPVADLLGYRHTKQGNLVVVPEEAKTVKFIFLAYLYGYDCDEIAEILTEKQRSTMRGRQEWNRSMVANVMQNERRWGALEARKTIVINYKKGKVARNHDDRCSAFVPEHHEGIVSPEIARAIGCIQKSAINYEGGFFDSRIITQGALKGFVGVMPSWGGIDNNTFHVLCRSVYEEHELEELHRYIDIVTGKAHSKTIQMNLCGYDVPYGVGYLTARMPSLTITPKAIRFNAACHKRLEAGKYIEMFYHPIMQAIIIRASDESQPAAFAWEKDDGSIILGMPAKEFSCAVYENMCWRRDYSFRLRGITKERDGVKIMFFFLDEPQIILGKKQKKEMEAAGIDMSSEAAYIPYKEMPNAANDEFLEVAYGYPEEWNHSIGMSYELRAKRDYAISSITGADITADGVIVENPLVGHIPTRQEIGEELDRLLISM